MVHIIFKVTKPAEKEGAPATLELYDGSGLALMESESFSDVYTLNFHLQTLATKYKIAENAAALVILHDKAKNGVELYLAKDENSLFVS